jgi:hypothetical protein
MSNLKTYAAKLADISTALNGACNSDEIMELLGAFGITREVIKIKGLDPLAHVNLLFANQQKEYGDRYFANAEAEKMFKTTYLNYMNHVRIARIAFKGVAGALHSVTGAGSRKRSVSGFVKEARAFYLNLTNHPELLERMAVFNITIETVQAGLAAVEATEKAHQTYTKERGEAQEATAARDAAFDALYSDYSDLRAIARIALANKPQLLEQMGISAKRR